MRDAAMVYAYIQDVPIGEELYQRIIDALGPEPLDGSLLHLCVRRPDGGLRYIDAWASKEQCGREFDERIHPAVDAAFGDSRPDGEPEVHHLDVVHASGALLTDDLIT
ncbi:hypothetical protein ACFYO0_44695 [Streptomyces sp. NPDC006365]|uniref:hypothetical protein n=1 Tax=Streptomyces sp. NPDC006365 TaxID=3364744 RepID=UPI0036992542